MRASFQGIECVLVKGVAHAKEEAWKLGSSSRSWLDGWLAWLDTLAGTLARLADWTVEYSVAMDLERERDDTAGEIQSEDMNFHRGGAARRRRREGGG